MTFRVTHNYLTAWAPYSAGRADLFVTMIEGRILVAPHRRQQRITMVHGSLLMSVTKPVLPPRWTLIYANVFGTHTPDFTWLDEMSFINEVFPFDISYQSVGATKFATDVIIVDSGNDQRISRWDQPLMEYDIAYGVRTMEQLHALIAFFRIMRGRRHGFLYNDYVDNNSRLATRIEARSTPDPTVTDQVLGTGDGSTYQFQITKLYPGAAGSSFLRIINKPKPGSVAVAVNGLPVANYVVDCDRGVVIFTSAETVTPDEINGVSQSTPDIVLGPSIIGTDCDFGVNESGGEGFIQCSKPGGFNALMPGMQVISSGWTMPRNNWTKSIVVTVRSIDPGGQKFFFDFAASDDIGSNEQHAPNVTVTGYTRQTIGADFGVNRNAGIAFIQAGPGAVSPFSKFHVGQRITSSGWINPTNNWGTGTVVTITSIDPYGVYMVLAIPPNMDLGANESGATSVTLQSHPAPDVGAAISCGFEFYVPVRFDTDRLPVNLEEYGVGSATDVKLVELRPSETLPDVNLVRAADAPNYPQDVAVDRTQPTSFA